MTTLILIAACFGILFGIVFPLQAPFVKPLGDLFLLALKMIVAPLIFASLTAGAARTDPQHLGKISLKTLLYFLLSMSLAIALGLFLVQSIRPGVGVDLGSASEMPQLMSMSPGEFLASFLEKLFQNPFQALAETNVLGMVVFAILLGVAISLLKEKGRPLRQLFESLSEVMLKMTHLILYLAPPGVFALVAVATAQGEIKLFIGLGKYIGTVVAGLTLHAGVTLPLLAWILGGRSIRALYHGARPAMALAFGTASSAATLPLTYKCATESLKVPPSIASFVTSLGATVNMNGTALYEAVAAVFIAQAYGLSLYGFQLFLVFVTSLLAAVGAAAIPSAGLVTMVLVLNAVGLPLEGIGLILGVDRFLDMCRTSVNVLDDLVGCVVVNGRS